MESKKKKEKASLYKQKTDWWLPESGNLLGLGMWVKWVKGIKMYNFQLSNK